MGPDKLAKTVNGYEVSFYTKRGSAIDDANRLTTDTCEQHNPVKTPDGWLVRNAVTGAIFDTVSKLDPASTNNLVLGTGPFSTGRRWRCDKTKGRARFWFVIVGPGTTYGGKPSKAHKLCRLEVFPDDIEGRAAGYEAHGEEHTYSHAHLKKYGVLEDL